MRRLISLLLITSLITILIVTSAPAQAQTFPAWAPNVAYAIGVQVTYQDASHPNHLYKCQQAHTSQVGWEPPNVPALWIDEGAYSGGGATNTPIPPATNTPIPTATTVANTNTPTLIPPTASTGTGGNGSPFSGTPYAIPGTVQAENYNTGGEGIAYHDSDTTNSGGQYRTSDGVDIEATTDTGGGYNVGWTATGEWEKYTVNVTSSGTYTLDFRVASAQTGSSLHLEVDGANVSGTLSIPNTGAWQTWTDVTKSGVSLTAGQHVLRVFIDAGGMNINWFSISGTSATATTVPPSATTPPTKTNTPLPTATTGGTDGNPFSGTPYAIPGKVEAENYNTGGEGIAYHDSDTTNSGGQYRTADGVDIEATTDTGGGYDVGWTATGEWMKYTVNVTASGSYTIDFRVASAQTGSALHLDVDGANVTGSLTVPNTGGWQTWTDVTKSGVTLSAGQHVMRLFTDVGGMNYNWFNITSGSAPATNTPTFVPTVNTPTGPGKHVLIGYWHNFDNGSGFIPLPNISSAFDVIDVAFAAPGTGSPNGQMVFVPYNETTAQFQADIATMHSRGKKVLISSGGYVGSTFNLNDTASMNNFINSMESIISTYGFDGMDIDWEQNVLMLNPGDKDITHPTTPDVVNTINAITTIHNHFGNGFMISYGMETFFIQLGYSFYGGTCISCDTRAGALLPVLYATRSFTSYVQVQLYNSGAITALDNQYYTNGGPDFLVAMTDMLLHGFPVAGTGQTFPALSPSQVAVGVPASSSAASAYVPPAQLEQAFDYLDRGISYGSAYHLTNPSGYPGLAGFMTWSINWDQVAGFAWSSPLRPYLNGLPQ